MNTTNSLQDFYNPALGIPWANDSKMNTTEHLEKIKLKCLANLALAEKRTAGRWKHNDGHRMLISVDSLHEDSVLYGDDFEIGDVDAAYIAACAGAAEADWRSTIAAIEIHECRAVWIAPSPAFPSGTPDNVSASTLLVIIAAWPEELL